MYFFLSAAAICQAKLVGIYLFSGEKNFRLFLNGHTPKERDINWRAEGAQIFWLRGPKQSKSRLKSLKKLRAEGARNFFWFYSSKL